MFLEHMNYLQVEEYLAHDDTILIPIGSLENHGKHMPLGTDTLIPNKIAQLIEQRCDVVIAPTINYGATDDLEGFTGTVSIGVDGLIRLLKKICGKFYDYGFRRFLILNGHGGNSKSIDSVGQWLYKKGAYLARLDWWLIAGELRPEWRGGHGGGLETAGIYGVDPSLVKTEYLELGEGIRNDVSDELPSGNWTNVVFKGANVPIPRRVRSITDNGWLAHGMATDPPTKATLEWGQEMLPVMADYVVEFREALKRAELSERVK
ncbi:MAG: creatininase family protein [Lachnospiraceae bacterium]|nr:creatininase family protein [Lachnospiraceae bacterium]